MRKRMTVGVICLAASLVFASTVLLAQSQSGASAQITPLNMKTGLWQTTMTGKYTGLPPQVAAAMNPTSTYKNCVRPKDLAGDAWAKNVVGKCSSVNVLKSTGTDTNVEAKGCSAGNGMTAEGHGKFHLVDSEHLTGTMDVTFSGNTPFSGNGPVHMLADYTSKWVGASCPAEMD